MRATSREKKIPTFLKNLDIVYLSWIDICKNLVPRTPDDSIQLKIPDVVVFNYGRVDNWIYTDKNGVVKRKPQKDISTKFIHDDFHECFKSIQPEQGKYIAILHQENKEPTPIDTEIFDAYCSGEILIPPTPQVIQLFIPARGGDGAQFRSFRSDCQLDERFLVNFQIYFIDLHASSSDSKEQTLNISMNRAANQEMEVMSRALISRIEASFGYRVVRLSCEFVQDSFGRFWLVRTTQCAVVNPDARTSSPPRSAEGQGPVYAAQNSIPFSGKTSDASSTEKVASAGSNRRTRGGTPKSSTPVYLRPLSGDSLVSPLPRIPNARLGGEMPLGLGSNALGSTQISGCPGDFCSYSTSFLDQEIGDTTINSREEFRKKLMATDRSYADAESVKYGRRKSFLDRTKRVSSIHIDLTGNRTSPSRSPKRKSKSPGKQSGDEGKGGGEGKSGDLGRDDKNSIPYRLILQSRIEASLVQLLLSRRKRGQDGEYVSEDNFTDLAVSHQLPELFAKEVECCDNCFKMYHFIDGARTKALNKLLARNGRRASSADDPLLAARDFGNNRMFSSSAGSLLGGMEDSAFMDNPSQYIGDDDGKLPSSTFMDYSVESVESMGQEKNRGVAPRAAELRDRGRRRQRESKMKSKQRDEIDILPSEFERPVGVPEQSFHVAIQAIDSLTKLDVAEIRTMSKPPAAVEVVVEAVMALLLGKVISFAESRRLLQGGESFLVMLRQFRLEDVTDARLRLVEPYVDNQLFRPENVVPISYCASKFCAWVLGVVQVSECRVSYVFFQSIPNLSLIVIRAQAARWHRGVGHKRTNLISPTGAATGGPSLVFTEPSSGSSMDPPSRELTFVQKLEKKKKLKSNQRVSTASRDSGPKKNVAQSQQSDSSKTSMRLTAMAAPSLPPQTNFAPRRWEGDLEAPSTLTDTARFASLSRSGTANPPSRARVTTAVAAAQQRSVERLTAQNKATISGEIASREFRCADGITKMPYVTLGTYNPDAGRKGFIVVQDFFDTCDATAILFKQIVSRHDGCQVLCFNYPGQANTVWPRPPPAERDRGAIEPVHNNDWLADRLHELLQYTNMTGDLSLEGSSFNVLGIGNGAAIAASFLQRWGTQEAYRSSINALVSVNGFLNPDPQLSAILHSATQLFETTPHNRPDIPVSFWSRFVFSEDYLTRVHPNLALNIYTAIVNPITSEGRMKIARGCLLHRDLRGGLSPEARLSEAVMVGDSLSQLTPVRVPVILLQCTDDMLVNAANVDPFLAGRKAKHLWSHQLNYLPENGGGGEGGPPLWVGRRSSGPLDYSRCSLLGRPGLRMLLQSLSDERGAFVMWVKAGHAVQQENKVAVLDLLDALTCPTGGYLGIKTEERQAVVPSEVLEKDTGKSDVIFRIGGPRKAVRVLPDAADDEEPASGGVTADPHQQEVEATDSLNEPQETVEQADVADVGVEEPDVKGRFSVDFQVRLVKKSLANFKAVDQDWFCREAANILSVEFRNIEIIGLAAGSVIVSGRAWFDSLEQAEAAVKALSEGPFLKNLEKKFGKAELIGAARVVNHVTDGTVGQEPLPTHPEAGPFEEKSGTQSVEVIPEDLLKPSSVVLLPPQRKIDLTGPPRPALPSPLPLEELLHKSDPEPANPIPVTSVASEVLDVPVFPAVVEEDKGFTATSEQRKRKEWAETIPTAEDALALERQLAERRAELLAAEGRLRQIKSEEESARNDRLLREQEERRLKYEQEDRELVARLERELAQRRADRLAAEKQRRLEVQMLEESFVDTGLIPEYQQPDGTRELVKEMPPMDYHSLSDLPAAVRQNTDVVSLLDKAVRDEEDARRRGDKLSMEEYEDIRQKMLVRQLEREERLRHVTTEERDGLYNSCARDMQRVVRGFLGRKKARRAARDREVRRKKARMLVKIQALARGYITRKKTNVARRIFLENFFKGNSAIKIQKVVRGHFARKIYRKLLRLKCTKIIQRVYRGHLGRRVARKERERLALLRRKMLAAQVIQSVWRMKVAKEEYRSMRIHKLAAMEIQRLYRGHLGRKTVARRRKWEAAAPGPERIQLGLKMIEESKVAFERQQEEIDALHRAQEKAEARVSHIYTDLKESEKELAVLERELQEIDHIEKDLQVLTHERELLVRGITNAAGMPRTGVGSVAASEAEKKRKAEAYALEMTIQIKRAEREKKRQELETEFAAVFQEVNKKKQALERLEASLADMEATRERKDREFRRLQRNLMQLLMEQKRELDDLRERGIELETATATTAAAATATAMKAREHEKRSKAMFSQTEELMKFQFMSMSLSYFSSLNMLKQLRDMNADTTSAAVASSADAAAAAAASATAANLPRMRKLEVGAGDFVELSIQKKKVELASMEAAENEVKKAKASPLPDNVRLWSVDDVSRWLTMLSLTQYVDAFREATVDGPFLMELREEDLVQVLGIEHKLHVRKILVQREKLKPLSEQEKRMAAIVEHEAKADALRKAAGIPDLETVFSQARNGRIKRLEESLNLGFPVDMEDPNGHTLLLVAAQNSNKRMVEMLLARGANINHQNTAGNTALHYAMAFDTDGLLGEYLIERGADDTVENAEGLTPYDGIGNV